MASGFVRCKVSVSTRSGPRPDLGDQKQIRTYRRGRAQVRALTASPKGRHYPRASPRARPALHLRAREPLLLQAGRWIEPEAERLAGGLSCAKRGRPQRKLWSSSGMRGEKDQSGSQIVWRFETFRDGSQPALGPPRSSALSPSSAPHGACPELVSGASVGSSMGPCR